MQNVEIKRESTINRWFKLIGMEKITLFIGLIVLCTVLSVVSPYFLKPSNLATVGRQIAINTIIAVGMTLVIISGGTDLSVGSIVAVVSCVIASLMKNVGIGIGPSILIGLIIGGIFGAINGTIISKFKLPPFLVTMAMMTIGRGVAFVYTNAYPISGLPKAFGFIGEGSIFHIPFPFIVTLFIVFLGYFLLSNTVIGNHIYAVGNNPESARLAGINVEKTLVFTYMFSGLMSSISAIILTSRLNSGQPIVGQGYELDAIAAVVLGGTSMSGGEGSILGTILGTLVIGVLNNGMNLLNVSPYFQMIVKGMVILIATIVNFLRERHMS